MSAVADVLDALMTMLSWLEKPPYGAHMIGGSEKNPYSVFSQWYVSLGIELATNAQRDAFAENPVETIQKCCLKLADYSDTLIRDLEDPLILQPASLDIVTAKRSPGEEDFGLVIDPVHHGLHVIGDVRFGSLAYKCGRIRPGDEIVQTNYQTVVGWSTKKLLETINFHENNQASDELILTLKKMPKNLAGCGRIYVQPMAIPIKNQQVFSEQKSRQTEASTESEAATLRMSMETSPSLCQNELYVAPDISFTQPKRNSLPEVKSRVSAGPILQHLEPDDLNPDDDTDYLDDIDDEVYLPTTSSTKDISPTQSVRSLLLRPRSTPIRRATISAGSPSKHQPYINVSEVNKMKNLKNCDALLFVIRQRLVSSFSSKTIFAIPFRFFLKASHVCFQQKLESTLS